MINIERALSVSEYQCQERTDELMWLATEASKCHTIVEVGSWLGCSTIAMAENTRGLVYAVDTFEGSPELMDRLADKPKDWLFNTFTANTKGLANVIVMRMTSLAAAANMAQLKIKPDMVFIDASHDYQSVHDDITAWLPLIASGGILSGHDRTWQGVKQAIDELLPSHQVAVGAIWYVVVK